jgi:hypothetical protein
MSDNKCPICEDYNQNAYTYASISTNEAIYKEANIRTVDKIQQMGILEEYYDMWYITLYRLEYNELYNKAYILFKNNYKYNLIEKYCGNINVCDHHYTDYLLNVVLSLSSE